MPGFGPVHLFSQQGRRGAMVASGKKTIGAACHNRSVKPILTIAFQ
jgi:hypothetical protein